MKFLYIGRVNNAVCNNICHIFSPTFKFSFTSVYSTCINPVDIEKKNIYTKSLFNKNKWTNWNKNPDFSFQHYFIPLCCHVRAFLFFSPFIMEVATTRNKKWLMRIKWPMYFFPTWISSQFGFKKEDLSNVMCCGVLSKLIVQLLLDREKKTWPGWCFYLFLVVKTKAKCVFIRENTFFFFFRIALQPRLFLILSIRFLLLFAHFVNILHNMDFEHLNHMHFPWQKISFVIIKELTGSIYAVFIGTLVSNLTSNQSSHWEKQDNLFFFFFEQVRFVCITKNIGFVSFRTIIWPTDVNLSSQLMLKSGQI